MAPHREQWMNQLVVLMTRAWMPWLVGPCLVHGLQLHLRPLECVWCAKLAASHVHSTKPDMLHSPGGCVMWWAATGQARRQEMLCVPSLLEIRT